MKAIRNKTTGKWLNFGYEGWEESDIPYLLGNKNLVPPPTKKRFPEAELIEVVVVPLDPPPLKLGCDGRPDPSVATGGSGEGLTGGSGTGCLGGGGFDGNTNETISSIGDDKVSSKKKMEIICPSCKSDKVSSKKKMIRTSVPKSVRKKRPNAKISYGRVYYEHTCASCNYVWEEETHL